MAATAPNSSAADTGTADPLISAHQTLRSNPNLQFQFQDYHPAPPPPWMNGFAQFLRAISPTLQVLFWIGLAAVLTLLVAVLLREVAQRWGLIDLRKKQAKAPEPVPAFRPTASRARALLEEADRLASEGRYSEAARVLLHRSIEDIERAYPITIGPAATSREIAQIEPLSAQGRQVFSQIARAVETSLFGERPLDAQRFAECRAAYSSFALGRNA